MTGATPSIPSKIERELGWRATESFESGIEKTVDWYLANEGWWRPIRDGTYRGERLGMANVKVLVIGKSGQLARAIGNETLAAQRGSGICRPARARPATTRQRAPRPSPERGPTASSTPPLTRRSIWRSRSPNLPSRSIAEAPARLPRQRPQSARAWCISPPTMSSTAVQTGRSPRTARPDR